MNILNTSKKFLKAGVCAIMLITAGQAQAQAQQVTVDASIDSLQLLIGEQAKVKLEISMDAKQKLQLPFLRDTLVMHYLPYSHAGHYETDKRQL